MIAWAGGGGGPDAFIALANHPEWGHGHTVWGEVRDAQGMAGKDSLIGSQGSHYYGRMFSCASHTLTLHTYTTQVVPEDMAVVD